MFGARSPRKSESVYYNLQFWLFLGHFWTFSGLVIFTPETFLGRPTWLVALSGCLAPFVLPRKASKHPFVHFSWNLKLSRNERKCIHIFVPCQKNSFLMTSHEPRRHPAAFGARTPRNSESMYHNLQFWLFFGHFWTFLDLVIFSPETFLGVSTWLIELPGCLAPFVLPRKASKHPICSFLVKPKIASKWT